MASGERIISEQSKKLIESSIEKILLVRNNPAVIAEQKRKSAVNGSFVRAAMSFGIVWTRSEDPELMLAFAGRIVPRRILVAALAAAGREVLSTLAAKWALMDEAAVGAFAIEPKLLSAFEVPERWAQGKATEAEMTACAYIVGVDLDISPEERNSLTDSSWSALRNAMKYTIRAAMVDSTDDAASAASLSVGHFISATCDMLCGDPDACRAVKRRICAAIRKNITLTMADLSMPVGPDGSPA